MADVTVEDAQVEDCELMEGITSTCDADSSHLSCERPPEEDQTSGSVKAEGNGDVNTMDVPCAALKRTRADGICSDGEDETHKILEDEKLVDGEDIEALKADDHEEEGRDGSDNKGGDDQDVEPVSVTLGPKTFRSSVEMFDYLHRFMHVWPPNVDINKYEHLILLDLIKKGHSNPTTKISNGVCSFQVRLHPLWKSKCFFVIREDGFVDDFSFRRCVDNILPLPDNMKVGSKKGYNRHNHNRSGGNDHHKGSYKKKGYGNDDHRGRGKKGRRGGGRHETKK